MFHTSTRRLLLTSAAGLIAGALTGGPAWAIPGDPDPGRGKGPDNAPQANADPSVSAVPKVYIDPGHGGDESGAVANGLVEKDINLDIALQMRDYLKANYTVDIRMSRTTDVTRSLSYRSSDANNWGADRFISIHANAGGGTGFESFRYTSTSSTTRAMHDTMHTEVLAAMRSVASVTDRGKKTANFHVLRETSMPAVLTENLFLDNDYDASLLKRPEFITATARGHAIGIAKHLGLSSAYSMTVDNSSSRFSASGNWGTSSWNSQRYGTNYRYTTPVFASDPAWYKLKFPSSGSYRVRVWYPSDSGYNNAAPYIMVTSSGNQVVYVDQRSNGGKWVTLGTFSFDAGDYNAIAVSRWTGGSGYVIADAVRIVRV